MPESSFLQISPFGQCPKPTFSDFASRASARSQLLAILPFGQAPEANFQRFCLSGRRPNPTFSDFTFRANTRTQLLAILPFGQTPKILPASLQLRFAVRALYARFAAYFIRAVNLAPLSHRSAKFHGFKRMAK